MFVTVEWLDGTVISYGAHSWRVTDGTLEVENSPTAGFAAWFIPLTTVRSWKVEDAS